MGDITTLLARVHAGDNAALDALFTTIYPDLRRIARARLATHQRDLLLDTTSLVHECYLKYAASDRLAPASRVHFLAYAAQTMRSIIVDFARARSAERRGGDAEHVPLDTEILGIAPSPDETEVIRVHEALDELASLEPRLAKVVEMRYFGGLSEAEVAQAMGVAERTVRRDWNKARLLLANALAA